MIIWSLGQNLTKMHANDVGALLAPFQSQDGEAAASAVLLLALCACSCAFVRLSSYSSTVTTS